MSIDPHSCPILSLVRHHHPPKQGITPAQPTTTHTHTGVGMGFGGLGRGWAHDTHGLPMHHPNGEPLGLPTATMPHPVWPHASPSILLNANGCGILLTVSWLTATRRLVRRAMGTSTISLLVWRVVPSLPHPTTSPKPLMRLGRTACRTSKRMPAKSYIESSRPLVSIRQAEGPVRLTVGGL